eukprot:3647351-Karenia_brevis.AAC.1
MGKSQEPRARSESADIRSMPTPPKRPPRLTASSARSSTDDGDHKVFSFKGSKYCEVIREREGKAYIRRLMNANRKRLLEYEQDYVERIDTKFQQGSPQYIELKDGLRPPDNPNNEERCPDISCAYKSTYGTNSYKK